MDYYSVISQIIDDETVELNAGRYNAEVIQTLLTNLYTVIRRIGKSNSIASIRIKLMQLFLLVKNKSYCSETEYLSWTSTLNKTITRVEEDLECSSEVARCIEKVYAFGSLAEGGDPFGGISEKTLLTLLGYPKRLHDLFSSSKFARDVHSYIMSQYDIALLSGSRAAYEQALCTLSYLCLLNKITQEQLESFKHLLLTADRDTISANLLEMLNISENSNITSLFKEENNAN